MYFIPNQDKDSYIRNSVLLDLITHLGHNSSFLHLRTNKSIG